MTKLFSPAVVILGRHAHRLQVAVLRRLRSENDDGDVVGEGVGAVGLVVDDSADPEALLVWVGA